MFCYRYMGFQNAKWSLEDGWYKTSRPSEFNDPFDCRAIIKGAPSDQALKEYIDQHFDEIRKRAVQINPAWAKVNMGRKLVFEKMSSVTKIDWAQESMAEMRARTDAVVRIMCFSRAAVNNENADNLMWGHYADKGAGIRIGFDLDAANKRRLYHLEPVRYDRVMPTIDLTKLKHWLPIRSDVSDFFMRCLYTKDSSWAYEDEVRMIIPRNYPIDPPMFQERWIEGKKLDFVHLSYDAIRSVDFGVRADIGQCKKLVASIRGNDNTQHIIFRKAEYRKDIYGYKFVEL